VKQISEKKKILSRRQFLKTAGAAGIGAALIGKKPLAQDTQDSSKNTFTTQEMPKRAFGNTGVKVPILSLGGSGPDFRQNQLLLRQAVKTGVTYWDSSESYFNGGCEEGIGKYFERYPEDREKIFLVTKSKARNPEGLTRSLTRSLERLKTLYVDSYFLHGLGHFQQSLTADVKKWVEKAKAEGKIRFFGFSAHSNVEEGLETAAKLGWIDGIMTAYNYRTMGTDRMKAAIDAAAKAGIGLTAMKTQAKFAWQGTQREDPPEESAVRLTRRFMERGFTMEQAKLGLVWENPLIATICSEIFNLTMLMQNVAAAVNQVQLTGKDRALMARYVAGTAHRYCPGCTRHCQVGPEKDLPIGDIMRWLMYARDYGDRDRAKTLFRSLPSEVRRTMTHRDYTAAEKRCPNGLPIGRLMREAVLELA
jgi:predicted aldo/keto reductase-like oxidoreductase